MREIKFRAWDRKEKKIYLFDKIQFRSEYNVLEFGCDWDEYGFGYGDLPIEIENAEIMQFTGLKDKNGVEIYEGDIIKLEYANIGGGVTKEIGEVFWQGQGWNIKPQMKNNPAGIIGGKAWKDDIEIIGNIYENPELLTKP